MNTFIKLEEFNSKYNFNFISLNDILNLYLKLINKNEGNYIYDNEYIKFVSNTPNDINLLPYENNVVISRILDISNYTCTIYIFNITIEKLISLFRLKTFL